MGGESAPLALTVSKCEKFDRFFLVKFDHFVTEQQRAVRGTYNRPTLPPRPFLLFSCVKSVSGHIQSGLSSRAKHGGTVFSAVSGSIKDLTTVPGFCNHLGPPNLINFAPALVFLSVLNIYSFAIEFGGCICYFWSKWISRAKYLTFPGDGRRRWG